VLITFFTYKGTLNYSTTCPFASDETNLVMLCIINECNSGNIAHEELNHVITTCPLSPICVKMIWKQHKNIKEVVQSQVAVIE